MVGIGSSRSAGKGGIEFKKGALGTGVALLEIDNAAKLNDCF